MKQLKKKELDEKELLEILEIAKETANGARELCKMVIKHNRELRQKVQEKQARQQALKNLETLQ